jgi:hypothetical protein
LSRLFLAAVLLANLTILTSDAIADGSIVATFFGRNHTSDQLNRQGNGKPIRVDTSSMNRNVKTYATINKGLRAIGLPSLLGPPKVQRQSVWVKGRGFVDITDQAQRQVDADFRRANGGVTTNRTNAARPATTSRAKNQSSSPMQPTVELLRTGNSVDWMTQVDFDSIEQRALQSLMMNPAEFHSSEFKSQAAMIEDELKIIDSAAIVEELLSGIDRLSLTFAGGSRSKAGGLEVRVIEADRPDDPPCVILIKPIKVGGKAKWLIEDITVPAESLSLLQLYQYRLIENLPQMPTYAAWVHPGRLQQSKQVTLVLDADPTDPASFRDVWQTLADDTKTWPIAKSKYESYERLRIATQPVKLP